MFDLNVKAEIRIKHYPKIPTALVTSFTVNRANRTDRMTSDKKRKCLVPIRDEQCR